MALLNPAAPTGGTVGIIAPPGSQAATSQIQQSVARLLGRLQSLKPQVEASGPAVPGQPDLTAQLNDILLQLMAVLQQALVQGTGPSSPSWLPPTATAPGPSLGVNSLSKHDREALVRRIRSGLQRAGVPLPPDERSGYKVRDGFQPASDAAQILANVDVAAGLDERYKPLAVWHTDANGRVGRYIDQPGQGAAFSALRSSVGNLQAVAYTAGLSVDTDGSGPHHGDLTASSRTSLKVRGTYVNGDRLPAVALPPGLARQVGAHLGDIVQVTAPNGTTSYAMYADNSDDTSSRRLGEGTIALLKNLGYAGKTLNPNSGGVGGGVKYTVFPGSGTALKTTEAGWPSNDQVQVWGRQLAAQIAPPPPEAK